MRSFDANPRRPFRTRWSGRPRRTAPALWLLLGAALGAGAVCALQRAPQSAQARTRAESPYARLAVFARVLHYLETDYVDTVDRLAVIDNAIRGMLQGLDPHTQYFSAEQVKLLRGQLTGRYMGVGLTLTRRRGEVVVLGVEPGSPAARGGILPGDRLLRIDDVSVARLDLARILLRLRGRRGTRVLLETARPGVRGRRRTALIRAWIRQVAVHKALLPGDVGYVSIRRFARGVTRDVREAIRTLRAAVPRLRGLVLDLRDNPGGLMDESVRLADLFVAQGILVSKVGKRGRLRVRERAHPRGTLRSIPLVVLVNRGSASASEVVAACLQDHRRARIFGARSFGKGTMQSVIPLPGGARLKLTVARYYRPSGGAIDHRGVTPDVVVPAARKALPPPPKGVLAPAAAPLPTATELRTRWLQTDPTLEAARRFLAAGPPNH